MTAYLIQVERVTGWKNFKWAGSFEEAIANIGEVEKVEPAKIIAHEHARGLRHVLGASNSFDLGWVIYTAAATYGLIPIPDFDR